MHKTHGRVATFYLIYLRPHVIVKSNLLSCCHAVGLWHAHPEANPTPSNQDYNTTREYLDAFNGTMYGFLFVIVGNRGNPLNMAVWMAGLKPVGTWLRLEEI